MVGRAGEGYRRCRFCSGVDALWVVVRGGMGGRGEDWRRFGLVELSFWRGEEGMAWQRSGGAGVGGKWAGSGLGPWVVKGRDTPEAVWRDMSVCKIWLTMI